MKLDQSMAGKTAQERFEQLKDKYRHHSMHPDPIVWQEFHDLISLVETAQYVSNRWKARNDARSFPADYEEEFWQEIEQRMKNK